MDTLQFGVFLSPRAADIGRLRDHAQVAEAAGFDYVSIQDHPYVPDFLDIFALIGALIGQTSRAWLRLAIHRSVSGGIIRSWAETWYQLGLVFHTGSPV